MVGSIFLGAADISIAEILTTTGDSVARDVLLKVRVPRILMAVLVGGGLSISGAIVQALFRNPLASPYTLGMSQAASAAVIASVSIFGTGYIHPLLAAIVGCAAALALLLLFLQVTPMWNDVQLLLVGVMLGIFFSSLGLFVEYLSSTTGLLQLSRWVMGSMMLSGYRDVAIAAAVILPSFALTWWKANALDLCEVGPDIALSRGLSYRRYLTLFVVLSSLIVSVVVGLVGPIGFVGLVVPHVARLLKNSSYDQLIPVSFLLGALFLTVCDTLARVFVAPAELPVGMLTALLGAPCFFYLFLRGARHLAVQA